MNNILIDLHNSSYPTQPHLIIANCPCLCANTATDKFSGENMSRGNPEGGLLPYMGYIGMCRCEGYGFQAVYSRIGYINQSVWV